MPSIVHPARYILPSSYILFVVQDTVAPLYATVDSIVLLISPGATSPFVNWYLAIAFATAVPYNSIVLSFALSLASFIMFIIIGVAINAIIASITITAKSSINVNPFFIFYSYFPTLKLYHI